MTEPASALAQQDGNVYYMCLAFMFAVCIISVYYSKMQQKGKMTKGNGKSAEFQAFQWKFIFVYITAVAGDWLQGPYVYALYDHYGYTKGEIGVLFTVGFLASAVVGTFVAGLSDRIGRKKLCIVYGVIYSASCITKHSSNWYPLMLGRLLGGTATSILFSAFETWMVHEHEARGFAKEWLSDTFSTMMFCNGLTAIVSGVVASAASDRFGIVAPFDVAMICFIVGTAFVFSKWEENYGQASDTPGSKSTCEAFAEAFKVMMSDPKIWILGLIQSGFEGAMYVFVFSNMPILREGDPTYPPGIVFSCYMTACMIGSSIFSIMSERGAKPNKLILVAFFFSALGLLMPALSANLGVRLAGFFMFEASVGVYFPCIGMLRGQILPNDCRATIMNFFRIPLNILVVAVLFHVETMSTTMISLACTTLLITAITLQVYLNKLTEPQATAALVADTAGA